MDIVLSSDARQSLPPNAWGDGHLELWAFVRAHLLAGKYVLLHGKPPEEFFAAPNEAEIAYAVNSEIDHLERHVAAGENDPYEASYAMLQGSRIIYETETGDPAISKFEAGEWGLENLPEQWHEALRAAKRAYNGEASPDEERQLADSMAPFVAMVRQRLQKEGAAPDVGPAKGPGWERVSTCPLLGPRREDKCLSPWQSGSKFRFVCWAPCAFG